jgi:predicted transcriptional regulator
MQKTFGPAELKNKNMKVSDLIEELNLRVFEPGKNLEKIVSGGYASDLLSDVMAHAIADQVWITLQNHVNVIAVASLKDLAAIILVHGQEPAEDVLDRARQEGISLLGTGSDTFRTSALVFKSLGQDVTGSR